MADLVDKVWPFPAGEMATRIREFPWEDTSLGSIDTWPRCLTSTIDLILPCGFPMIILWGPQLIQIYNDQYRALMNRKHPSGLGKSNRECWPEVWHINEPIHRRVWAGETLTFEDALYPITRSGVLEDAWFTLTFSPLRDEEGLVVGILVTVFETTARKLAEQRRDQIEETLRASSRHKTYLLELSDALRGLRDPVEVQNVAARILGQQLGASRVAYAEDGGDGETVVLARNYTDGVPGIEGVYRYADYGEVLVRELRAGRPVVRPDIANDPLLSDAERSAHAALQLGATLNVPLLKDGKLVAILTVHFANARDFQPDEIALAMDTAERTWDAVALARAESALRKSEERLKVVVEELKHRTRNLLGIVQSIALDTFRFSASKDEFEERFFGRLSALSNVQDLLSTAQDKEITVQELIILELDALGVPEQLDCIDADGPAITLRNSAVQNFALALHELATNARKYGALSGKGGRLSIHWTVESSQLRFDWCETGLAKDPEPTVRGGFGRDLLERALPFAFGGATDYQFTADGLRCVISMPLSRVARAIPNPGG